MRALKPALAATALLMSIGLTACAEDYYGPPAGYADVDYDAYYDGHYGPFYGGYWGPDAFYYSDRGGHHFHRDAGGHFRRSGGAGFNAIHGHAPMAGGHGQGLR